jgi:hypothetical protein
MIQLHRYGIVRSIECWREEHRINYRKNITFEGSSHVPVLRRVMESRNCHFFFFFFFFFFTWHYSPG